MIWLANKILAPDVVQWRGMAAFRCLGELDVFTGKMIRELSIIKR